MYRLAENPTLQRLAAVAWIERRCPLTGKTRYATKAQARQFAASTLTLTTAFRCAVCGGYHLANRRRGQ